MIRSISEKSQWILSDKDVRDYYLLTRNSIEDLLKHDKLAKCMQADPNGKESLEVATKIRRDLRALHKKGALNDSECAKVIEELRPRFIQKTMTRDQMEHTITIKSGKSFLT